jgi:hypothetical protein
MQQLRAKKTKNNAPAEMMERKIMEKLKLKR